MVISRKLKTPVFLIWGIDVDNDFKADYVISSNKKEIFKKLKAQVDISDEIYLASDPDREGGSNILFS